MRLIDADALDKTLDDVCVGICNCCSAFDAKKVALLVDRPRSND